MFTKHGLPVAPVLTTDEHMADAQTGHNGIYCTDDGPVGPVRRVRYPLRIGRARLPIRNGRPVGVTR